MYIKNGLNLFFVYKKKYIFAKKTKHDKLFNYQTVSK